LPRIPQIKVIKTKEVKPPTDDDVPESAYPSPSAKDRKAEGIMYKNYRTQVFAKYVRPAFKEKNLEVFGGSKKHATDDSGRIVAVYCTNARVDKMIFKMIDEDFKLELPMMKYLPRRVMEDIIEEHHKEICLSNWSVDFRKIRKGITRRCLNILTQVITNNELNNEVKNDT